MFGRIQPLTRDEIVLLVGTGLAGGIGLLPLAGGGGPVATLAFLCLIAPACGALAGARGIALFPFGLAVPAAWFFALIWSDLEAASDLPTPIWGALVVAGLHALGLGLGRLWSGQAFGLAGLLLLLSVLTSALPVQAGFGRRSWAREHPSLARVLVEASPLVLAMEASGLDWTHSHQEMYALSGVEWFQRRPYRGPLAGSTTLLVGCAFALVVSARGRRRPGSEEIRTGELSG